MAMKRKELPVLAPKIFEHEQFGQCRFVTINGEPWFVAADLCRALEIKQPARALSRLDDDEKSDVNISHTRSKNGATQTRKVLVVSEPGLYRLIFTSRKAEARQFQRWVCHEVLPSIRKYGYYVAPNQRIIEIKGEENLKRLKALCPGGTVEIKRTLCDWEENECGEIRFFDSYEVVVHANKKGNA